MATVNMSAQEEQDKWLAGARAFPSRPATPRGARPARSDYRVLLLLPFSSGAAASRVPRPDAFDATKRPN